jgi:DNA-binding Lrp family transcriptional regulator
MAQKWFIIAGSNFIPVKYCMDQTDRRILHELQRNAELSNVALAERVALSPSSCLRRVQRLKDSGVLRRTVALVDPESVGRGLIAIVEVMLDHHGANQRVDFVARLNQEPAVLQAWSVTGDPDVILTLTLRDMKEYQRLCERLFTHDPNVTRFRSHFAMDTYKNETALPLDNAPDA